MTPSRDTTAPAGVADLRERVLEDDYPIYGDYLYVVDGKVYRSDFHGITVRDLKRRLRASEVKSCDIVGRQDRARATLPPSQAPDNAGEPHA